MNLQGRVPQHPLLVRGPRLLLLLLMPPLPLPPSSTERRGDTESRGRGSKGRA